MANIPTFRNPEIQDLYDFDLTIPVEKIETILTLPRESLIADLEDVVKDFLCKTDGLSEMDFEEEGAWAPLHALMLLGGLRSKGSLALILEVHQQSDEWIEFWFSDWFLEDVWISTFWCGQNQLERLVDFIKYAEIQDDFAKTNVVNVLTQVGLHAPERREEVVGFTKDLMEFYLEKNSQEDADLIASSGFLETVERLKIDELLPLAELLYQKDLVDEGYYGDWKAFLKWYKKNDKNDDGVRNVYPNILDWYVQSAETIRRVDEANEKYELERQKREEKELKERIYNIISNDSPFVRNDVKIGRNDPCPCGSGKKYKKCCGA